jgi:hypothetical protein
LFFLTSDSALLPSATLYLEYAAVKGFCVKVYVEHSKKMCNFQHLTTSDKLYILLVYY